MKSGINYVTLAAIVALIEKRGLKVEQKKGWLKVVGPTAGHVLYVRDTKSCGLIHVSGMTDKDGLFGLTVAIPKPPTGRCTRMVDFSRSAQDTLDAVDMLATEFLGQPEAEPEVAPPGAEEPEFAEGEPDPIGLLATGDAPA
jgi:hypothetical protein